MKARHCIALAALFFAVVMITFRVHGSIASAQDAPSLDAGPAAIDAGTAPSSSAPAKLTPPPDPTADPGATIKYVRQVHEEDGIPAAIAISLHLLGVILIRKGRGGWLKGGYLVGVTAGTGLLLSVAGYFAGELTIMALLIAALTTIGQALVNTGGPAPAKAAG